MTKYDPVLAMLEAAPIDDEPVTDDDRRHIEEGRQAYRLGLTVSAEEIRQALFTADFGQNRADRKSSTSSL